MGELIQFSKDKHNVSYLIQRAINNHSYKGPVSDFYSHFDEEDNFWVLFNPRDGSLATRFVCEEVCEILNEGLVSRLMGEDEF